VADHVGSGCTPNDRGVARRSAGGSRPLLPFTASGARRGQSLVEFSLVVPIILSLVFAIITFGILYEDKIAMDNAARDGVRWATQNPDAWDNSDPAAASAIQGQIQGEGGTVTIPNDNEHISIRYYTVDYTASPLTPVLCGYYDVTGTGGGTFYYLAGSSAPGTTSPIPAFSTRSTTLTPFVDTGGCLVAGNLIKVTVTRNFKLPIPIISALFSGGVSLQASAVMTEEIGEL
jgi:Flp pilus assembly protein TadG